MEDKEAYIEWFYRFYSFQEADRRCTRLKDAREALFLTHKTVGARLNMTASGYRRLERSDLAGTISLNTLKKCAEALGCELTYQFKPKTPFSHQIWNALAKGIRRPGKQSALAWRAGNLMFDPWFRRKQGWSANSEEQARHKAREYNRTRSDLHHPWIITKGRSS